MPVLRNARHERMAQLLAQGKSATQAYAEAGYKQNSGNAIRLKGNESISARRAEIQKAVEQRVIDGAVAKKEDILRILFDLASTPNGDKWVRASDKRAAAVDYARLRGWVIERTEQANVSDFENLSDLEAAREIKKKRDELDRLHKVAEKLAARARAH
jgi:phage terminase small subunit